MTLGFTGTQEGITLKQFDAIARYLAELNPDQFRHGDCIGADETAHYIALSIGIPVVIHPPSNPKKRAHCPFADLLSEKPYLDRNRDIVDASQFMLACPKETKEQLYSGTWSTIRYAKKRKVNGRVLFP